MTIHWKALEEHFLIVAFNFSKKPFPGEIILKEYTKELMG
jgi:hypothetical protein